MHFKYGENEGNLLTVEYHC